MTTLPTPYYGGGQVPSPADVIQTSGAPSTKLINLGLGTLAVDNAAGIMYGLVSKTSGSANWEVLGGGPLSGITTIDGNTGSVTGTTVSIVGANSGAPLSFAGSGTTLTATITPGSSLVATLTGSTGGGAISPSSGNINLVAGTGITITGSGSSITFDASGAVGVTTLTGNSGGALSPTAGNINVVGSGALAFAGASSTLTGSITPGAALVATLTGTSGGAISPTAGNITFAGGTGVTVVGSGSTLTINAVGTGIATLTGNTGGALSPSGGNITITGTGALSFSGAGSTLTGAITPGTSLVSTLTGDSGGALSPTAGNFNVLGTANQITIAGSGSTLTHSLPAALTAPGSVTATTTLTATLGAITATNGNLVLGTAGNKVSIATGANGTVGTSGAMTGGAVTVSNTSVTANSKIFCYPEALGTVTVPSSYYISSISAGVSFTITSAAPTDTSSWNYWIIN